jgi:CBF1 interacting corepressor
MSLKFLNHKALHPSNKQNQKLLFLAEEETKVKEQEEQRARKEFLEEQETFKEKLSRDESRQRTQINSENYRKKLEREKLEEETKNLNPEFQPSKRKRRAKKHKEEFSQPLSFMYVLPPGLKALQEKEEKERLTKEADLIAPKGEKEEDNYDILKNAPSEGKFDKNTTDVKLVYKPFAVELKNVKCTKCGAFGHSNSDKECPLINYHPLDAKRLEMEDLLKSKESLQSLIQMT